MEILLVMVLAHLIGDYLLQWRKLAEDKDRGDTVALILHALLYALAMNIVFRCVPWNRALSTWAILSVSHGIIDFVRVRADKKWTSPRAKLISYCVDQLLHLGLIVLCWRLFLQGQRTEIFVWISVQPWFRPALCYGLLLGVIWQPTAILVRKVLALLPPPKEEAEAPKEETKEAPAAAPAEPNAVPAASEAAPEEASAAPEQTAPAAEEEKAGPAAEAKPEEADFRSGELIGKLERVIVAALVLAGAASTIGFVLTAKSVARFKQMDDRNFAERYLVGTLLSVCVALGAALIAKAFL